MEFDEDAAVAYMRENATTSQAYSDDELLNIIDIIWDYYEDHGLLDISFDDNDDDVDADALVAHVEKMLRKDRHAAVRPEDVRPLVFAEMQYEDTLD